MKKFLSLILFFSSFNLSADCKGCLGTRLEVAYSAGQYIGIDKSYGELDLFLPCMSDCLLVFADARGYRLAENKWKSKWASSGGLGMRTLTREGIFGINAYVDWRESEFKKNNNRFGIGIEWLGRCIDVRLNGYISSKTHKKHHEQFHCSKLLDGGDLELGMPLIFCNNFLLYTGFGPYFYGRKHGDCYWGMAGRLDFDWKTLVTLELRGSYDHVNDFRGQIRLILSLPFEIFCTGFNDYYRSLILQPVYRNGLIFFEDCHH